METEELDARARQLAKRGAHMLLDEIQKLRDLMPFIAEAEAELTNNPAYLAKERREELALTAEYLAEAETTPPAVKAAANKLASGLRSGDVEIDLSLTYDTSGVKDEEALAFADETHQSVVAALGPLAKEANAELGINVIAGNVDLAKTMQIQEVITPSMGFKVC